MPLQIGPVTIGPPDQPQTNPDDITTAPAAGGTKTPVPPAARNLTPQEQDAIVRSIGGREGWFIVGGQAVPETKMATDTLGHSTMVPTGSYTITLSNGKGNTDQATIYPGADGGWVPQKVSTDVPKDATHPNVTGTDGSTYVWDTAQNKYVPAAGLPTGEPKPKEGQTRQSIENGRNVTQTFSGGNWVTTGIGDLATPGAAKQGDTRQSIENGRNVTQTFDGTNWRTTSIGASATPGAANEGDKRQIVEGGKNVTQTFMNGQWVTTGVGAAAGPGAANEGDTRQTIENGRNVTQTFKNGQWLTTSIGDVATPGAAKEGDTRPNVQGGFKIQEIYRNGQWIPDTSVTPTRFTPQDPTVVSAPNNTMNLAIMQNGQLTTQPNPNFMPTSTAEVAAAVAQLQSQAQAQRDQLLAKQQSGAITADQAAQQFDQWWSQNVEPRKSALDAAQRTAVQAEQMKAQEQQRQNLSTAQTAAGEITRATAGEHRVGPGFGAFNANLMNAFAGGKLQPMSADQMQNAFVTKSPDYSQIYENATAQALKHISPTAAQIATGQPIPTGLAAAQSANPIDQLNRSSFNFAGGPAPAPQPQPAAAAATPTPQQLANQNAAAAQITNVGGFSGAMPSTPMPYAPGPQSAYTIPGLNPSLMPGYVPPVYQPSF